MGFFGGDLTLRFYLQLPCRSHLVPRVQKLRINACSRAHQSYGCVRLIQRNCFLRTLGNSTHHLVQTFLKDTQMVLRNRSLSQCSCSNTTFDAEKELSPDVTNNYFEVEDQGLDNVFKIPKLESKSCSCDAFQMDALPMTVPKNDARTLAIEVLAARVLTVVELRKKLRAKKFPLSEIEGAIADLQGRGLLNDVFYAESFSRSRWLSLSWSPRRIKQALLKKGVSEVDVDKAMKLVFHSSDKDGKTPFGMSMISMNHLISQASKHWLRSREVPLDTRKSRIIRWLQYRGFNWDITAFVLRKLTTEYPP